MGLGKPAGRLRTLILKACKPPAVNTPSLILSTTQPFYLSFLEQNLFYYLLLELLLPLIKLSEQQGLLEIKRIIHLKNFPQ